MDSNEVKYSSEMNQYEDGERSILNNKFKHRDALFLSLHEMGKLSHNNLAVQLGISSSGLNAVIHKANAQGIDTVAEEQKGRYKYYFLTPVAEAFTVKYLTGNDTLKNDQGYKTITGVESYCMPLQRFKRVAGEEWEIILDDFLSGHESRITVSRYDELSKAFAEFCEGVKLLLIDGGDDELLKVKKAVGNVILSYRLEEYLSIEFFEFETLSLLCDLYDEDQDEAFNFIDKLCAGESISENARRIVKSKNYIKMGIKNRESVFAIANIIEGMFEDARQQAMTKEEAGNYWKQKFPGRYKGLIRYLSKEYVKDR